MEINSQNESASVSFTKFEMKSDKLIQNLELETFSANIIFFSVATQEFGQQLKET